MPTIRELRGQHGLTQQQLAELLGTSQTMVGYWERFRGKPSARYHAKLIRVFNIGWDDLVVTEREPDASTTPGSADRGGE